MSDIPPNGRDKCVHCNAVVDRRIALRLWDGRWYCRRCVVSHSERLVRSVNDHSCLEDTLTFGDGIMLRQFFTLWGIGFGCMIVIMLIVLPLDGVLFYAGLLLAMPVLYVSCSLLTLPQTICIENGSVEVRTPLLTRRFRFSDCEWDVDGRLEDRTWYPFSRFFSTTPAIVLRVRDLGSRNTYFACIDDEARALWRDFLTLAESGCAACAQSGGEKHA